MRKIWVLLIFASFILSVAFADSQPLKIHFLDVGEGDSILIEAPNGKIALIDAGNLVTGLRVAKYLKKKGINELDHLIFTHPHLDHIGGAFFVLQMVEVKNIYDNGEDLEKEIKTDDIYRWYDDLVRKNDKYRVLEAGDTLFLDEIELKILWPNKPFISSNFNVNSLVVMVKYGVFRCLLTGDLTIPGEEKLLKNKSYLEADILKVGHHGYDDASSKGFLRAISPKIAIISVNEGNIRGYPSSKILARLEEVGAKVYRTDKDGNIVIQVGERGEIGVETEREE